MLVSTRDGESFEFDEVVLTAPLGWLKQHPEAFDPPLPPRLTKAIESIGYGCLEKVRSILLFFFSLVYLLRDSKKGVKGKRKEKGLEVMAGANSQN